MRKPVKSSTVNRYKIVEGLPSVPIRGTRVDKPVPRRTIALYGCVTGVNVSGMSPAPVISAVAQAASASRYSESSGGVAMQRKPRHRPIRLYTRGFP